MFTFKLNIQNDWIWRYPKIKKIQLKYDFAGVIMHELMHAVGFWHEQSRADRDDYVTINWDNIKPGHGGNFKKYSLDKIQHLGADYDYCSLMHYKASYFAIVSL